MMSNQHQQEFQSIPLDSVESQWEIFFNHFDKNCDGKVSINELHHILKQGGAEEYNIPPKILNIIAQKADHNDDGYISFREFLHLIEEEPITKSLTTNFFNKYIHYTIVPRGLPRLRTAGLDRTDGDYEDEYSCNPPALCMIIVSLIEILFFTLDVIKLRTTQSIQGPMASKFIYNPHRRHEAWRFLTYMFVHVGQTHLTVNLIVQLLLGVPLEMVHHGWRIVIIYLSGVLAGSLATSVSDPNVYLAGASGGVYALITAHVATIIINWSEMEFAVYQLLVFGFLITFDTGSSIYNRYFVSVDNQIGYTAHLAGAVAGLLVGVYTLRNLNVRPWEKKLFGKYQNLSKDEIVACLRKKKLSLAAVCSLRASLFLPCLIYVDGWLHVFRQNWAIQSCRNTASPSCCTVRRGGHGKLWSEYNIDVYILYITSGNKIVFFFLKDV